MAKAKAASKTRTNASVVTSDQPEVKVLYPTEKVSLCKEGGDKPPLDAETAKEILGWMEEGKGGSNVRYGGDYLFSCKNGDDSSVKVRCKYNVMNRPLSLGNVLALKQEILRGRWRYNGEPVIIGKMGHVLNGQHQLIALVLADKDYAKDPGLYPALHGPPTIDKLVAVGVDEDDAVVNTMDTCKPRTLADVIYRSPYFADLPPGERKQAARATDYAIRLLWVRTAENLDGFSPRRTHSESVNFLERHQRILGAIDHVSTEDSEGKLCRFLGRGYCAALLYLFATSKTDQTAYLNSERHDESIIDFSQWGVACDWFVMLAGDDGSMAPIRKCLAAMIEDGDNSLDGKMALLIKAWNLTTQGKKLTEANLTLHYQEDEDGFAYLDEHPVVGGIDIGSLADLNEEQVTKAPPKEEQEEKIKTIKQQKQTNGELPPAERKQKTPKPPKDSNNITGLLGKTRWIMSDDGEPYQVRVVGVRGKSAVCKIANGFQGAGSEVVEPFAKLLSQQPSPRQPTA